MSNHIEAAPADSGANPWLPIVTLQDDLAVKDLRLESGAVVKGYRCANRFAGHITYWTRIGSRLTAVLPVAWREVDQQTAKGKAA